MATKLGIVAGGGDLPARLIAACRAEGREYFVLAFHGQTDEATVSGVPHAWVRLGDGEAVFRHLHEAGVRDLVMAGRIRRPSVLDLRPDFRAARVLASIGVRAFGDDGLLRAIVQEMEEEGFRVVGVDSVLGNLISPEGPIGSRTPDAAARVDIERGVAVARLLGAADIGQAVVVDEGIVLGVEAVEGTDALVERCAILRKRPAGGVLVKVKKPDQERRVDLPTVGPQTIRLAATASLSGIAVEAGQSLILDRDEVVRLADEMGLFVVGVRVA